MRCCFKWLWDAVVNAQQITQIKWPGMQYNDVPGSDEEMELGLGSDASLASSCGGSEFSDAMSEGERLEEVSSLHADGQDHGAFPLPHLPALLNFSNITFPCQESVPELEAARTPQCSLQGECW